MREIIIIDIQHENRFLLFPPTLFAKKKKEKKTEKINWLFVPVDCNKNTEERQLGKKVRATSINSAQVLSLTWQ